MSNGSITKKVRIRMAEFESKTGEKCIGIYLGWFEISKLKKELEQWMNDSFGNMIADELGISEYFGAKVYEVKELFHLAVGF